MAPKTAPKTHILCNKNRSAPCGLPPVSPPDVSAGPDSRTPSRRRRNPQRTAAVAANAKITLSKGGRVQIADSRPGSMVKSRRRGPSLSPPVETELALKLWGKPKYPTKAHQMPSHDSFKLDLIAAAKGIGGEGTVAEDIVRREPPYDPDTNPTGVEMWKDFAIYRRQTKDGNGSVVLPTHNFGVAHTPTLTWKLWSSRQSERWIKKQKKVQFNFPAKFYRRAGMSVGNHFQGSPVLVDGKIAFKVKHIKSQRSKIIPLDEIGAQGRCTYYFPNGFDRPGQETGEIWTQERWNAGQYAEGEELADVLDEFIFPCKEMEVIRGP